jgi:hypothetical protein
MVFLKKYFYTLFPNCADSIRKIVLSYDDFCNFLIIPPPPPV